jgi:hypothetical protein
MELVKRNSAEFKKVKELLEEYETDARRKKLIKLYAHEAGSPSGSQTLINEVKGSSAVIFDITYASIRDYLRDRSKKLFRDGKMPSYCFKNSAKSDYQEFPFEFAGKLKKELLAVIQG